MFIGFLIKAAKSLIYSYSPECSQVCRFTGSVYLEGSGFRVWGFKVWGLGFRVEGSGFRVWGLRFGVWG